MDLMKLAANKKEPFAFHYLPICFLNILWMALSIFQSSCKKFVSVNPPVTASTDISVYTSDASAIAVLNGLYAKLSSTSFYSASGIPTLSAFAGLSADELTLWSGVSDNKKISYYKNELSVTNGGTEYWDYNSIYTCRG